MSIRQMTHVRGIRRTLPRVLLFAYGEWAPWRMLVGLLRNVESQTRFAKRWSTDSQGSPTACRRKGRAVRPYGSVWGAIRHDVAEPGKGSDHQGQGVCRVGPRANTRQPEQHAEKQESCPQGSPPSTRARALNHARILRLLDSDRPSKIAHRCVFSERLDRVLVANVPGSNSRFRLP
jgi:hypothetical protein